MRPSKSIEGNPWDDTFRAVYSEEGLIRRGVVPAESLISIHSSEGTVLYPHFQFKAVGQIEPGLARLAVRTGGLEIWAKYLKHAIDDGIMNEYTAAAMFAGRNIIKPGEPSYIEELDSPQTTEERRQEIERSIDITMKSWRSP
jgi:hypothetical protein